MISMMFDLFDLFDFKKLRGDGRGTTAETA
jgi:hypothetical protein